MKKKKKSNKLFFQLFIDVLLIAVVLLTFAYFHHVRPTEYSAVVPEQNNSGNETDNTSENNDDWSVKFSDKFLTTEITETLYKSTDINVELT